MKQFMLGAIFGVSCGIALSAMADIAPDATKGLNTFSEAIERVHALYIQEPGYSDLIDKALHGMLQGLDPHSRYMNAKEYAAALSFTAGGASVGLVLTSEYGLAKVITAIAGSPAALAGIEPGDRILAIDGKPANGLSVDSIIEMLRGPANSQITLTIQRQDKPIDVTLTRATVALDNVTAERKGNIGYVRISSFQPNTDERVASAIAQLKQQVGRELKGYIIDLRNNPGGLLNQAIQISDEFLNDGQIVSLQGRSAQDNRTYSARQGDIADGKPILVLINEGSAAGAEIVAGALQDNKRAKILGMKSFGEGTIQTIVPLSSGNGALRLTTARYFTPAGHPIQAVGVTPDILVSQKSEADSRNHMDREEMLLGHLPQEAESLSPSSSITYPGASEQTDDFQLSYAVNWMDAAPLSQSH